MSDSKQISQLEHAGTLPPTSQLQLEIPTQLLDRNFKITLKNILDFITKDYIGLGKVDNTSDAEKELSIKAIEALSQKANLNHGHSVSDIDDFFLALANYLREDASIPLENIIGLIEILQNKSDTDHKHEINDVAGLNEALDTKAQVDHTHNLNELNGFQNFMETISDAINSKVSQESFNTTIEGLRQQIAQVTVVEGITEIMPNRW